MTPQDLAGLSISEKMGIAERKIEDALMIIDDCILVEMEPRTESALDSKAMVQDFYDIVSRAYERVRTTFWEIIGD